MQARLLTALALLYLSQGLPMGLAFEALPSLLREQGFETAMIGMVALAILPWALRFLWAPHVDRQAAVHRGRVLVILQAGFALSCAAIALLPEGARGWPSLALVVLGSTLAATQNTATDGLARLALPRERLGWANGFQVGGFSAGMLLGGGLVLVVKQLLGWQAAWLLPAAVAAAALPLLPGLGALSSGRAPRSGRIGLRVFLERPRAFAMLGVAATFFFGRAFVGDLIGPALHDTGVEMAGIGLTRMASTGAMAAGAVLIGAACITRFGAERVGPIAGMLWAVSLLGWHAVLQWGSVRLGAAIALSLADGLVGGVAYAAFLTLFMRWASAGQAGTDVTLLMSTETMSNVMAMMLGGMAARLLGLPATFQLAAALMLAAMVWAGFAATLVNRSLPKGSRHAEP